MKPRTALLLLLAGAGIWTWQSAAVAAQDLRLRPVALAAFREAPLPEVRALPLLESAAAMGGGRADALLRLGEGLDAAGGADREARADALYRAAAVAFPAWGLGQYRLAIGLLRSGDEASAEHHMRVAAGAAGNHPALLQHLGDWHRDLWRKAGDPGALLAAVGYYRQAVVRDGTRLREVLLALEGVLGHPRELRAVVPDEPLRLAEFGLHFAGRGEAAAALEVLEALPPEWKADPPVLEARARSRLALGETAAAAALFHEWLDAPGEEGEEDHPARIARAENALRGIPPGDRAAFFEARAAADPYAGVALARARAAAGDGEGARAAADGALARLRATAGVSPGAAEREAMAACHLVRMEEWIRRKAPLQAAVDAAEAARLEDTPDRWRAAARLYADGGDEAGARTAYDRALHRLAPGAGAARAALEAERGRRLAALAKGGRR